MTAKPTIEFAETRPAVGRSGGAAAASYYVFLVAEKEVAVEVYKSATMTRDDGLPLEKIKVAVQTFLEGEVGRLGMDNLPENLVDCNS
jgi:hypothetical protein